MTSKQCFKLLCMDGLDKTTSPGQAQSLTDGQSVSSVQALPGGTISPSISLSPNGQGSYICCLIGHIT